LYLQNREIKKRRRKVIERTQDRKIEKEPEVIVF